MKKIQLFIMVGLLGITVMTTSGCFLLLAAGAGAAGAGTVVYIQGAYERNFNASVDKIHSAALKVLKDNGLVVTADSPGKYKSNLHFIFSDGKKSEITIESLTDKASKVAIRVGVMGDEKRSWEILDAIASNIKK